MATILEMDPRDTLITGGQAAAELGLSLTQVYKLALKHGFGRKIGTEWIFLPAEISWLKANRQRPGRPGRQEIAPTI